MIIGVTGGRDYDNWDAVCEAMQEMRPTRLVVGDAAGADALVRRWARERCVPATVLFANWSRFGKMAGPERNQRIISASECLVAFPGGRGTADCVRRAEAKGIAVIYRG
jgi:hypothetical protein